MDRFEGGCDEALVDGPDREGSWPGLLPADAGLVEGVLHVGGVDIGEEGFD